MRFDATPLPGVFVVDLERLEDERGFFARAWCADEFARRGLRADLAQCSLSFNARRGTLRGMHYQAAPAAEAKLVRCTRGRVFDVALDIRPESPAFRRWFAVELDADGRRALYIPEGVAHGFQTLEDSSELLYLISTPYRAELSRGVRWDDPAFAIAWPPADDRVISARDRSYPDFAAP